MSRQRMGSTRAGVLMSGLQACVAEENRRVFPDFVPASDLKVDFVSRPAFTRIFGGPSRRGPSLNLTYRDLSARCVPTGKRGAAAVLQLVRWRIL